MLARALYIIFFCSGFSTEGVSVVASREPGGTEIAEAIRAVLLSDYQETMCSDTELLLMFACRAQNMAAVVQPALQSGQWVLTDRFTDASLAYQGGGRGMSLDRIHSLAHWVHGDCMPDKTILLDAPVSVAIDRLRARDTKDRIESEDLSFFERVREMYLALARQEPDRFIVIDASLSLEEVQQRAIAACSDLLASVQ